MNIARSLKWRPATTAILICGLVALLIYSVVVYMVAHFQPTVELRIGSGIYHVQVADTEAERQQGLSGVDELKPDGGLLMKFDGDGIWGIWMKDMKIPIDIVWMDKDKKVVYVVKNASPELSTNTTFTPKSSARYVLELPAGSVDKAGIKAGVVADFDEFATGELGR